MARYFTGFTDPAFFVGGKGLEHAAPSGQRAISWDAAGTQGDVDVVAIVAAPEITNDRRVRLVVRGGGGGGSEDGYFLEATGAGAPWVLWKVDGGSFSDLADDDTPFLAGVRYFMRLRVQGTTLQARFWRYGDAEPAAWTFEETDSDLASGWVGVSGRRRDLDTYFGYLAVDTGGGSAPLPDETPGANQQATDFSGQTADAPPSGWTERWSTSSSTWTVRDDTEVLPPLDWHVDWAGDATWGVTAGDVLRATSEADGRKFLRWSTPDGDDDQEIVVRVRANDVSAAAIRLHLRSSGSAGDEHGYLVDPVSGDDLVISKYDATSSSVTLASASITFADNTWGWIRFRADGTDLKAKFWADGDPEPAGWTVETTDSEYSGGAVGVGNFDGSGVTSRLVDWDVVGVGTGGDTAPTEAVENEVTAAAVTATVVVSGHVGAAQVGYRTAPATGAVTLAGHVGAASTTAEVTAAAVTGRIVHAGHVGAATVGYTAQATATVTVAGHVGAVNAPETQVTVQQVGGSITVAGHISTLDLRALNPITAAPATATVTLAGHTGDIRALEAITAQTAHAALTLAGGIARIRMRPPVAPLPPSLGGVEGGGDPQGPGGIDGPRAVRTQIVTVGVADG